MVQPTCSPARSASSRVSAVSSRAGGRYLPPLERSNATPSDLKMASYPRAKWASAVALLLAAALGLPGCTPNPNTGTTNVITDIAFTGRAHRPSDCFGGEPSSPARDCSAAELESLRFAELGTEINASPLGAGSCRQASINFGDGSPTQTFYNQRLDGLFSINHTYNGWPGKKLVRVNSQVDCLGSVDKEISVGIGPNGREDFRFGFCVGPQCQVPVTTTVCIPVVSPTGPMPDIRRGSGVRITTNGRTIDYGSGHVFDASGDPSVVTPAGYLFPDRKKFSLVYRIGSQTIQGEAGSVTFIADQTAPLEICMNDNPGLLTDNTGNMLLTITVNERSAQ